MAKSPNYTHFGWQGLEFDVPEDWNIAVVQGEFESGYIRLDDDAMVRVELKWEGRRNRLTLGKVVDNYLRMLEKKAKKHKLPFEYKRNLKFAKLEGHDFECLSWESDFSAMSVAARCNDCGRVILARVLYTKGDGGRAAAKRLFSTLRDHPEGDMVKWEFFGFRFASPVGFTLDQSALKTGCIEMLFSDRKEEFEVSRLALAQVLLKRQSLKAWFKDYYQKRLKTFKVEIDKSEYRGHPALAVSGRTSVKKSLLSGFARRRYIHCRVWHCEETDKLFVLRIVSSKETDERFEKFCEQVACH